eukprot:XP_787617.2 PREDICTED: uncharacterized protein LOC582579 [Strongylocentrotus purpuratus]
MDYLFIGNGTKKSDSPTWALSGYAAPSQIRMNFSAVWIRFSTSKRQEKLGFRANITPKCSQDSTSVDTVGSGFQALDGETYQIASPNYPNNYPPNITLTWGFQLPDPRDCRIYVTFLDFETEQDNDQVIMGTTPRTFGSAIKETFSGVGVPLNHPILVQPEYYSTYAYIRFTSLETSSTARGFMANATADCEPGVSNTTTTGLPNEGTTTPTFKATTPVPYKPSVVVPIQQKVTNGTTGELLRRSYAITDRGMVQMFRGWVDVQGQGAPDDFCRVVRTDGKPFFSCLLAGSEEDDLLAYTSPNPSEEWFDPGYSNTWYMKDEDNDGRDDYCRCIGGVPSTLVVCLKAGANGFEGPGSDFLPPNSPEACLFHQADPFFGF